VANEYGSFGIERYQVSLGAQRRSEQPPGRDMDRSLHLFSAEVAPTNRRHLASLYFSGNPSIETLGIVFYPYSPEHDVLQIHVSLHNDDFAYYYEVAQTEKPCISYTSIQRTSIPTQTRCLSYELMLVPPPNHSEKVYLTCHHDGFESLSSLELPEPEAQFPRRPYSLHLVANPFALIKNVG
jgi:hypothetical protein